MSAPPALTATAAAKAPTLSFPGHDTCAANELAGAAAHAASCGRALRLHHF